MIARTFWFENGAANIGIKMFWHFQNWQYLKNIFPVECGCYLMCYIPKLHIGIWERTSGKDCESDRKWIRYLQPVLRALNQDCRLCPGISFVVICQTTTIFYVAFEVNSFYLTKLASGIKSWEINITQSAFNTESITISVGKLPWICIQEPRASCSLTVWFERGSLTMTCLWNPDEKHCSPSLAFRQKYKQRSYQRNTFKVAQRNSSCDALCTQWNKELFIFKF